MEVTTCRPYLQQRYYAKSSAPDFEQALHTCVNGLLASNPPTLTIMRITGQRLSTDIIEPLEKGAE